jgi:hypothetical protein
MLLMTMALMPFVPSQVAAQILRLPTRSAEPAFWLAANAGGLTPQDVSDGTSGSVWRFRSGAVLQYRLSLEKNLGGGTSVGLSGSVARAGFDYSSLGTAPIETPGTPATTPCNCSATMQVRSLSAMFRAGGGSGFHQVIEGSAGVVQYADLKRDDTGQKLAPSGGDIDPAFAIGYGFGYTMGQRLEVALVQDIGISFHQKAHLPAGTSGVQQQRVTRIALRLGLGSRSLAH